MTRVKASDLPKTVQQKLGIDPPKTRQHRGQGLTGPPGYRCACGLEFPCYGGVKGWEAHSDNTGVGHRRGQVIWEERPSRMLPA